MQAIVYFLGKRIYQFLINLIFPEQRNIIALILESVSNIRYFFILIVFFNILNNSDICPIIKNTYNAFVLLSCYFYIFDQLCIMFF